MLDWLIIGGGIHGTHLSLYLTRRKRVPPERLRVLDPHPQPLTVWERQTTNTGMEFLRSSGAHNLHFDPFSLATFARTREGQPLARFTEPYGRPSLALFMAHSARLIQRYHLDKLRIVGRALGLARLPNGWRVETAAGSLEARRVILGIGNTEQPSWPGWALPLRAAGAPIHHIFEPEFDRAALPPSHHTIVIGGGITAAQTALALAQHTQANPSFSLVPEGEEAAVAPTTVTLLMRHPARVHPFDADPGWITPQYLATFHRERDYTRRRAIIARARHRGSVPADVARDLQSAALNGLLTRRLENIAAASYDSLLTFNVQLLTHSGETLSADRIILATGFDSARPGGTWLDPAIETHGLPTAPDGYPIVDETLCWLPGLYVSGPLAELEVGPVARNFIGARLAADRIGSSL